MTRIFYCLLIISMACHSFAQSTVTWTDSFTQGVGYGSAKLANWNQFRMNLDTSVVYDKVVMKGTYNDTGITCSDPVVVNALAKALKRGTSFQVTLCDGNTWSMCWRFGGEVWINAPSLCFGNNCAGPNAYILRPGISNSNWGGVNTNTCGAPTQRMSLEFVVEPCPKFVSVLTQNAGSANSHNGAINVELNRDPSSMRYFRWASKEGVNYPSTNQEDVTGLAPGSYYLFVVTSENEPCYLGPVAVGP